MTAPAILSELDGHGVSIEVADDSLLVTGYLTDHLRETIRQHKPEILEYLRSANDPLEIEHANGTPVDHELQARFPDELVLQHAHPIERPDLLANPESLQAFRRALVESGRIAEQPRYPPHRESMPAKPEVTAVTGPESGTARDGQAVPNEINGRRVICCDCVHCHRPTVRVQHSWCKVAGPHNTQLMTYPMRATREPHECGQFEVRP